MATFIGNELVPQILTHPEVALYYPGHVWERPDWIKSLLLFFDGIGLLVPEYKQNEPEERFPELAGPLRDLGLLHYLIADRAVDKAATARLAELVRGIVESDALDSLAHEGTSFHGLSMSRMGFSGDHEIAENLLNLLRSRGLAGEIRDGHSIELHPMVRNLILVLLAQILRHNDPKSVLNLQPATDQFQLVGALSELLRLPGTISAGHVVAFDLQTVSVNLASVPLDEVLDFRKNNIDAHKKYARSVREYAREVSLLPPEERGSAFNDRQEELSDLANDLRRKARSAWRQPVSFVLGLAGACWTAVTNPLGALLSGGALLTRGMGTRSNETGAFSYMFAAHNRFG